MKKDINFYMNLNYPYEIAPEPDGAGFHAEIPLLPGCIAHGDTEEEALQRLVVAKCEWISGMLERHIPIPRPPYPVLHISHNWGRVRPR